MNTIRVLPDEGTVKDVEGPAAVGILRMPPMPSRPVPPSWASVARLLARWCICLMPYKDGTWDVLAGFPPVGLPRPDMRRVPFAALPQAILAVAARCEAAAPGEGEG